MLFGKDKDGPFYLSVGDWSRRTYDRLTGDVKVKQKWNKSSMEDLKRKDFALEDITQKKKLLCFAKKRI